MSNVTALRSQLDAKRERLAAIIDETAAVGQVAQNEGRELTDDDQSAIAVLQEEFTNVEKSVKTLTSAIELADRAAASREFQNQSQRSVAGQGLQIDAMQSKLPDGLRYGHSVHYENKTDAYGVGMWLFAIQGHTGAQQFCRDNGFKIVNAMEEGTPAKGGFAVPTPMAATIIRLVEQYGLFRQKARRVPMTSATLKVPRRAGGLTVFYPGEGQAITASDITFAQVQLTARKYAALAVWSTELDEDAVISMADLVTEEIAYAYAVAEDSNSFVGPGDASSGNITGIVNAVQAGSKVKLAATKIAWTDIDEAAYRAAIGKAKMWVGARPEWYISSYGYAASMLPILTAKGGTDMRQMEEGPRPFFLGYPVNFTQVMPQATLGADVGAVVFGDLRMGCYNGIRRDMTLQLLREAFAINDQIGMLSTMRADSLTHDVGTASESGGIIVIETGAASAQAMQAQQEAIRLQAEAERQAAIGRGESDPGMTTEKGPTGKK